MQKCKPLLLTLAVLQLLCAMSCDNSAENESSNAETTTGSETSVETEFVPEFPQLNFEGKEILFLTVDNATHPQYASREIYAETYNGELINDAVYDRNLKVETMYNVKIREEKMVDTDKVASSSILAGEDRYDVVLPYLNASMSLAMQGLYQNLNDVEYLQLENPWWDQRANESLTVNNQLFFTTGDISILDNECTMVLFFCKQLITDYSLESPYDLVKNGQWTLDKMFEMAFSVTSDLNGDGELKLEDDRFGFFCAGNSPISLYHATGEKIVDHNDKGGLDITMGSERSVEALQKILTYCTNDLNLTTTQRTSVTFGPFMNKQILFAGWALTDISSVRDSQYDFGLLPYPKFDENQESYSCLISTGLVPGVSIPVTSVDPEMAGAVLEAMTYYSQDTLTKAYYDVTLTNKYFRDEESGDMLDIIFANRTYDIGYIMNVGNLSSIPQNLLNAKSTDVVSKITEQLNAAQADLDKFVAEFTADN